MTFTSDKRYGRQGGRLVPPPAPEPAPPKVLPMPAGPDELRAHLLASHQMPEAALATAGPAEWAVWHDAEHKTRTGGGVLRHTHQAGADPAVTSQHAANLRAARDGKLRGAALDAILDRARYASARQADGHPLSPHDRDCLEVGQVVAARAARLAKRRGL